MTDFRRGFFRMGITGGIGWPSEEQEVTFKDLPLKLMPETETLAPSIVVRLDGTRSQDEVRQTVQEFLSALVWTRDRPAAETFSTVATGAPLGVGNAPMARMLNDEQMEYIPAPNDAKAKLALALYREARSVNMLPYAFLGYFKVLNVIRKSGPKQKAWIKETVGKLLERDAKERLLEIEKAGEDVGKYLYVSGRCAVAHAFDEPIVNPDDPADLRRLSQDLPVIKALARYAIEHELGVQSEATVWEEHLYELEGFRELFGPDAVASLKAGENAQLTIPETLSLRLQGQEQLASFSGLRTQVVDTQDGVVRIALEHREASFWAWLLLDFQEERLVFDAMRGVKVLDDETVKGAQLGIDYLTFLRRWQSNGVTEVWDADVRLGRSQPVMLVNWRPDWDAMDAQIAELQERIDRG